MRKRVGVMAKERHQPESGLDSLLVVSTAGEVVAANGAARALLAELDAQRVGEVLREVVAELRLAGEVVVVRPSSGGAPELLARGWGATGEAICVQLTRLCADCAAVRTLSEGEQRAALLVAEGKNSAEVALELEVAPVTIEKRLRRARAALGARSRAELAYRLGRAAACREATCHGAGREPWVTERVG